jgi:copper chaperone CopZ
VKTSHRIAIATTVLAVTALAFVIIRRRDAAEPATPVSGARLAPAGTSATAPVPSRLVTLEVGGMVCAACVNKVQTQIAKVPGVSRVEVSLADQKARVLCAGDVADTALTAAVRRAGPEYLGLVVER